MPYQNKCSNLWVTRPILMQYLCLASEHLCEAAYYILILQTKSSRVHITWKYLGWALNSVVFRHQTLCTTLGGNLGGETS